MFVSLCSLINHVYMVVTCRGNIRATHDLSLIYELSQVFRDTEHNLHQLGAEDGVGAHARGIRITNDGGQWWWLTIMRSKVRNAQMELEPCHRRWRVARLIYAPCRWRVALCHPHPAGANGDGGPSSERRCCRRLAGTRWGAQPWFRQKPCYAPEYYTVHSFLRLSCQGIVGLFSVIKNQAMRIMQDFYVTVIILSKWKPYKSLIPWISDEKCSDGWFNHKGNTPSVLARWRAREQQNSRQRALRAACPPERCWNEDDHRGREQFQEEEQQRNLTKCAKAQKHLWIREIHPLTAWKHTTYVISCLPWDGGGENDDGPIISNHGWHLSPATRIPEEPAPPQGSAITTALWRP